MYPLIKFVDSPDVDATVRLDLNDEDAWPAADDFDLGSPALLGDPDGVGSLYGNRTLKFTWVIKGPKPAALRRQSALAREVMREGGSWLLFQLTSTAQPVWFRTKRSNPGVVSLAQVYTGESAAQDSWRVSVSVEAEPFAYGPQETFEVTVANDPAASGGLGVTLPDIKGDAPAPLVVRCDTPRAWTTAPIAITDRPATIVKRGDPNTSGKAGTATDDGYKVTVFDAGYSTLIHCDPPPQTFAGRVRLFGCLYLSSSAIAQPVEVRLLVNGALRATKTLTLSLSAQLFDFGDLSLSADVDGYTYTPASLTLEAKAIGWSSTVEFRYLEAVPAPSTTGIAQAAGTDIARIVIDSENEYLTRLTNAAPNAPAVNAAKMPIPPRMEGGFPQVLPGRTNVLWLRNRGVNETYDKTHVNTLVCSYRPRWLYLAAS